MRLSLIHIWAVGAVHAHGGLAGRAATRPGRRLLRAVTQLRTEMCIRDRAYICIFILHYLNTVGKAFQEIDGGQPADEQHPYSTACLLQRCARQQHARRGQQGGAMRCV